ATPRSTRPGAQPAGPPATRDPLAARPAKCSAVDPRPARRPGELPGSADTATVTCRGYPRRADPCDPQGPPPDRARHPPLDVAGNQFGQVSIIAPRWASRASRNPAPQERGATGLHS